LTHRRNLSSCRHTYIRLSPLPSFDVPLFQSISIQEEVGGGVEEDEQYAAKLFHYIAITANDVILIGGSGSRTTHIFGTRGGMAAPHGLFSDALPSIS
jgi:hypothetical protein